MKDILPENIPAKMKDKPRENIPAEMKDILAELKYIGIEI